MKWWVKVDADLDSHPKARKAGYDGVSAFDRLLRLNGKLEASGTVPARFCDIDYLADLWKTTPETVENGIKAAINANLISQNSSGDIEIIGWDDEWKPVLSNAERQQAFRDRQVKRAESQRQTETVTESNEPVTKVTEHYESNDRNANRIDKNRIDIYGKAESQTKRQIVEKHLWLAKEVLASLNAGRKKANPASREIKPTWTSLHGISLCLESGRTKDDCEAVINACVEECRKNPASFQWFDAVTPWRPENFERKLARAPVAVVADFDAQRREIIRERERARRGE